MPKKQTVTKARTYTKLRQMETVALAVILGAHCVEKDGFAVYTVGWSDETVLKEFRATAPSRGYNLDHVIRMRRKMFGEIQTRVDKLFLGSRDGDGKVGGKVVITGALFGEIVKLHQNLGALIASAAHA